MSNKTIATKKKKEEGQRGSVFQWSTLRLTFCICSKVNWEKLI